MTTYIAHHGILGQKWGVRRFQNLDGSLTPEGKKRYQNPDGTLTDAGKKRLLKNAESLEYQRRAKELKTDRVYSHYTDKIKQDPLYKNVANDPKIKAAFDEMTRADNDPEVAESHERFMNDHAFHEKKAREWSKGNSSSYNYYSQVGGIDAHDELLNAWLKEHPAEAKIYEKAETRYEQAQRNFVQTIVEAITFEDLQYYSNQWKTGQDLIKKTLVRDLNDNYYRRKR